MSTTAYEVQTRDGRTRTAQDILKPWKDRVEQGQAYRKKYELQWMVNQAFAAGRQHLRYSEHEHRVVERRTDARGRILLSADMLGQHVDTVIGKIAADDFRPELLLNHDGAWDEEYGKQLNDAYAWGWDEEWRGDRQLLTVLRELVKGTGTAALWCYVERKGKLLSDSFPHQDGQPLLNGNAQSAVADSYGGTGPSVQMRPLREASICWRFLSGWNILPPPGVSDPVEFPYDLIVRPVYIPDLVSQYGDRARQVKAQDIRAQDTLASDTDRATTSTSPATAGKLDNHAWCYTGYQRPTDKQPNGETVVFCDNNILLAHDDKLPYTEQPYGPRPGVTYFRWEILPGRFFGRAFIERGIDPQKTHNKTVNQVDEIIDRGMPAKAIEKDSLEEPPTGMPLEILQVAQGAPLPRVLPGVDPGDWMWRWMDAQEAMVEKALGIHPASLGDKSPGVTPYAALALQVEQDAVKFDPIAQEFHLAIADMGRDTYEAMRAWGPSKQIQIAGEDDTLQAFVFNATKMPAGFKVRPAKGAALPRSQAAELQKIGDLWQAANLCGAVMQAPQEWLVWYKLSLDAGKAQDMPHRDQTTEQRHFAALENIVMLRTGQPVPVTEYQDPEAHVPEHRMAEMDAQQRAELGDQNAQAQLAALQQHIQWHLQMAQQNTMSAPGAAPTSALAAGPPQATAPGPPGAQQAPTAPAPSPFQ